MTGVQQAVRKHMVNMDQHSVLQVTLPRESTTKLGQATQDDVDDDDASDDVDLSDLEWRRDAWLEARGNDEVLPSETRE